MATMMCALDGPGTGTIGEPAVGQTVRGARVALPPPMTDGGMPLARTLARRRSVREFDADPLTADQIGQILWAAQGITHDGGHRTVPSAGALYPLETYVVTPDGVFHYEPVPHLLERLREGDLRRPLFQVTREQEAVLQAPAVFLLAAVYGRTERRYGRGRTPRYVHMEAGHAAQNILLQAVALGLGGVPIGAFDDEAVGPVLGLPAGEAPIYLVPVGRPRSGG